MSKLIFEVVQHLRPGGIEVLVMNFLERHPKGSDVYVVSLEGTHDELIQAWPRLLPYADRIICLNKPAGISALTLRKTVSLFQDMRPDVVHTHHVGPLFYAGFAARLARIRTIIHTEHDAWHLECPKRARLMKWLFRLIRPNVVADAMLVARQLEAHTNTRRVEVIHNGIDTDRFQPGRQDKARNLIGLPLKPKLIGISGRLVPVKNQSAAIRALGQISIDDVHLAIAGEGPELHNLRNLASDLGVSERTHFLGHLDDMTSFYRAVDIVCLPSHAEGMPLSLLEAQASGIPVVACDVGAVSEAVCGMTGTLIPKEDLPALTSALTAALDTRSRISPRIFATKIADRTRMIERYETVMGL